MRSGIAAVTDRVMDEPLVSVIIAIKDAERFLAQALDSVSAQTYRNYEIVVVDGASTDRGPSIAAAYPHTRCIPQGGTGLWQAWNAGIATSRGSLVTFLDSDDLWSSSKLADQVSYLSRHPATPCVIGRVKYFIEPGHAIPNGFKPALLNDSHVAYMPGVAMLRRSLFQRLGTFEEHWRIASDIVWFAKLRECGVPIGCIDDILLHKRVHSANLGYVTSASVYRQELTHFLKETLDRRRAAPKS